MDTALNEVYYNDNFGDPDGTSPDNPWVIDEELPGIDVETVALHESGHSLCVGHFGPPPKAVMNPVHLNNLKRHRQLQTLYFKFANSPQTIGHRHRSPILKPGSVTLKRVFVENYKSWWKEEDIQSYFCELSFPPDLQ
jgi:hypothetical protein